MARPRISRRRHFDSEFHDSEREGRRRHASDQHDRHRIQDEIGRRRLHNRHHERFFYSERAHIRGQQQPVAKEQLRIDDKRIQRQRLPQIRIEIWRDKPSHRRDRQQHYQIPHNQRWRRRGSQEPRGRNDAFTKQLQHFFVLRAQRIGQGRLQVRSGRFAEHRSARERQRHHVFPSRRQIEQILAEAGPIYTNS